MYYIYEIKNNLYHKKYIGVTSNYKKRFYQHKYMLENKKHPCKEMQLDYSISKHRCKNFMEYNVIYCTDNKEFASDLEYLFLYKSLVNNERIYNKKQIWFPSFIIKNSVYIEEIKDLIDNKTILHAYFNGQIGYKTFEKICKTIKKEYLIKIVNE